MGSILLVDDDPRIRHMLRRYLDGEGLRVVLAENIRQARRAIEAQAINLILLDLKLGNEDGLDFARYVQASHRQIAIIIMSSKDDVVDKVVGLEVGADDYIAKPFHLRELLARVKAVLRRTELTSSAVAASSATSNANAIQFGRWRLLPGSQMLENCDGQVVDLTTGEFRLLEALVCNSQRVMSRDQLLDKVANREWSPYDRTIDTRIRRLRRKIEDDPGSPKLIKTVRGEGYMLAVETRREDAATSQPQVFSV